MTTDLGRRGGCTFGLGLLVLLAMMWGCSAQSADLRVQRPQYQAADPYGRSPEEVARAREEFLRQQDFRHRPNPWPYPGGYGPRQPYPGGYPGYGPPPRPYYGPPAPRYQPQGAGRFWRGQWYPQVGGSSCWTFVPILGWTWVCGE